VLFLAAKFGGENPVVGLLNNTNVGGENCHRGSVLGSILGLTSAARDNDESIGAFCRQLRHATEIVSELDEWQQAHRAYRKKQ
jgi:hypothetical protein